MFGMLKRKEIDLETVYQRVLKMEQEHKLLKNSYTNLLFKKELNEQILAAMIELSKSIAMNQLTEDMLRKTSITIQKIFNIDEVYFARFLQGDKFVKELSFLSPATPSSYKPKLEGYLKNIPIFKKHILQKQCYQITSSSFFEEDASYYRKIGIHAACACPIVVDTSLIGVLGFNKIRNCEWSDEELSFCKIFSSLIATSQKKDNLLKNLTIAQQDLVAHCHILEGTINMVDGYMWYKNSKGEYVYCSPEWKKLFFGLPPEFEIAGRVDSDLLNTYRRKTNNEHTYGNICTSTDEHCKNQKKTCYYIEAGYINNVLFLLEVTKTPQFNKEGIYTGIVGIARNRSNDKNMIALLLQEYLDKGLAVNLNADKMNEEGVTAYWITEKEDYSVLNTEIFPRWRREG